MRQHGIGENAHKADTAPAVQDADLTFGEGFTQFGSSGGKPGLVTSIGAAKNSYGLHEKID